MPSAASPLLELRGVSVAAGDRVLIAGLDLSVSAGELVALRAPSGTGKTTLLRAVAGLDDPAAGEVRLCGRSPADIGWPAWRRRVVFFAQRPVALPGTVGENLARPFAYASAGSTFPEQRARELLERSLVGEGTYEQQAHTLSEGELQRVALIRALLVEPEVLLLDEATSALDETSRDIVEGLVRAACDAGMCGLVVTHDPVQAERWCARSVDLPRAERARA